MVHCKLHRDLVSDVLVLPKLELLVHVECFLKLELKVLDGLSVAFVWLLLLNLLLQTGFPLRDVYPWFFGELAELHFFLDFVLKVKQRGHFSGEDALLWLVNLHVET